MKKLYLILFIVFISTSNDCNAQYIIAGQVSVNDNYYDIIPDTSVKALNVHLTPYPGEVIALDLNFDGLQDLKIKTFGGGGLGGGTGGCTVKPINGHVTVAAVMDTSIGCCPQQYIAKLAYPYNLGDTISNNLTYYSGYNYIWSSTYGMSSAPSIYDWSNIGEHYLGLRLSYPNDTLYYWIRAKATGGQGSLFNFTIMDYACNTNPTTGIINESNKKELTVFPNPFCDRLIIECLNCGLSTISIFDLASREIMQQKFTHSLSLNTEQLSKGIYFYEVSTDKGFIKRGKLLKE